MQNFTPEQLCGYYNDFYRPDQQAVIIMGDIDVARVEATVKRLFEVIPKRENRNPGLFIELRIMKSLYMLS